MYIYKIYLKLFQQFKATRVLMYKNINLHSASACTQVIEYKDEIPEIRCIENNLPAVKLIIQGKSYKKIPETYQFSRT